MGKRLSCGLGGTQTRILETLEPVLLGPSVGLLKPVGTAEAYWEIGWNNLPRNLPGTPWCICVHTCVSNSPSFLSTKGLLGWVSSSACRQLSWVCPVPDFDISHSISVLLTIFKTKWSITASSQPGSPSPFLLTLSQWRPGAKWVSLLMTPHPPYLGLGLLYFLWLFLSRGVDGRQNVIAKPVWL